MSERCVRRDGGYVRATSRPCDMISLQCLAYLREHANQKEKCLVVFGVTLLSRLEITIPPCGGGGHDHHLIHQHQAENPPAATGGLDAVGDRQISRSSSGSMSEPSRSLP